MKNCLYSCGHDEGSCSGGASPYYTIGPTDTEESNVECEVNYCFNKRDPLIFTGKCGENFRLDIKFITKRVVVLQIK